MRLIVLSLLMIGVLAACSKELQEARNDPSKVIIRDPKQRPVAVSEMAKEPIRPTLGEVVPYILLSAASYEDDPRTLAGICDLPSQHVHNWHRDLEFSETAYPPVRSKTIGIKIEGLGYTVWINDEDPEQKVAAVVLRGTDFKQLGDWYSSFRWITRFVPFTWDQYQQTRDLMTPLVARLKEKHGDDIRIVATGHSLGGGLAQHAAFSSKHINDVYAFASSPVTGSSSLDWRVDRSDVYILRSYESGEILSALRWVQRRLLPLSRKDPEVTEARFNFRQSFGNGGRQDPISQHRAKQMACDLICHVENGASPSECS